MLLWVVLWVFIDGVMYAYVKRVCQWVVSHAPRPHQLLLAVPFQVLPGLRGSSNALATSSMCVSTPLRMMARTKESYHIPVTSTWSVKLVSATHFLCFPGATFGDAA